MFSWDSVGFELRLEERGADNLFTSLRFVNPGVSFTGECFGQCVCYDCGRNEHILRSWEAEVFRGVRSEVALPVI